MIILILCTIFNIWVGSAMLSMSSGNDMLAGMGLFFIIIGILDLFPIFSVLGKKSKVGTLSNEQNSEHKKYIKGVEILKQYHDLGINDINDINDIEERRNIQNIYNFCTAYDRKQKELEVARQEEANTSFQTNASIAAGVVLGAVLSAGINEMFEKDSERRTKKIRENIAKHK